jgi:hypothetical protein
MKRELATLRSVKAGSPRLSATLVLVPDEDSHAAPDRRRSFFGTKPALWIVFLGSAGLLIFAMADRQNRRKAERFQNYLADEKALAEFTTTYRFFDDHATTTGLVIDSWKPCCAGPVSPTDAQFLDDYSKHFTRVLSAKSSAERLREATSAVPLGRAFIADGTKSMSALMDELDRAISEMIVRSNAFRDGRDRDSALDVAKCERDVYSRLDARRRAWERSTSSELQVLVAIENSGGDIVRAMSVLPPSENIAEESRHLAEQTQELRDKCRDAFSVLQGNASSRTRF